MDAFALLVLSAILLFNGVNALELKSVEEGSCLSVPSTPINMTWVIENAKDVKYFGGGSRYNMYSAAALLPNSFPSMREFEFYYNSCFGSNLNLTSGIGSVYGLGDLLGDFELQPGDPKTEPAVIYFVKNGPTKLTIRHQVTLTDYKSFVFFVTCWMESNQRGWSFGLIKPNPDEETISKIEAHAKMLGYQRENFIFFRYETCPAVPTSDKNSSDHN